MKSVYVKCSIAATFVSKDQDLFNITQQDIDKVIEAPEWILKTLMFDYLLSQGYIVVVEGPEEPVEEKVEEKAPVVEVVPELPKEEAKEEPKEEKEEVPEKEAKPQKSKKK